MIASGQSVVSYFLKHTPLSIISPDTTLPKDAIIGPKREKIRRKEKSLEEYNL